MANLFEQPRNAGTLCTPRPCEHRHLADSAQSLVVKKLVEQTFEIRMVQLVLGTIYSIFGLTKSSCRNTSYRECRQKLLWPIWSGQDDG